MYSMGMYPLIDRPTRISRDSCTLIDNVFTNATNFNFISGILVNDISDHLPIFVLGNLHSTYHNHCDHKVYVKTRTINDHTITVLNEHL